MVMPWHRTAHVRWANPRPRRATWGGESAWGIGRRGACTHHLGFDAVEGGEHLGRRRVLLGLKRRGLPRSERGPLSRARSGVGAASMAAAPGAPRAGRGVGHLGGGDQGEGDCERVDHLDVEICEGDARVRTSGVASNRYLGSPAPALCASGSRGRVVGRAAGVDAASMEVLEAHSMRRGHRPTPPRPARAPPSLASSMDHLDSSRIWNCVATPPKTGEFWVSEKGSDLPKPANVVAGNAGTFSSLRRRLEARNLLFAIDSIWSRHSRRT